MGCKKLTTHIKKKKEKVNKIYQFWPYFICLEIREPRHLTGCWQLIFELVMLHIHIIEIVFLHQT